MRDSHCTGTNGNNSQCCTSGGIQTHSAQQRSDDTCSSGQCNSGRTLSGLQNCRQQEGEEDTDGTQNGCIGGDVVDHIRRGDYLAQNTAGCSDKQDGASNLQCVIGQIVEAVHLISQSQLNNTTDGTNRQCNNGLAQEVANLKQESGPAGHGSDGTQSHQNNRNDDGSQSIETAGQLAILSNQFFISLNNFIRSDSLVGALNLLADVLGKDQTCD